jgi:hypothetical protein
MRVKAHVRHGVHGAPRCDHDACLERVLRRVGHPHGVHQYVDLLPDEGTGVVVILAHVGYLGQVWEALASPPCR